MTAEKDRNTAAVLISRQVRFSATNRYENRKWTSEKNREVFGACYDADGQRHDYRLEVTLRGPVDPETGMLLNLRVVDEILQREVVDRFDQRFINREVDAFTELNPTVENLCRCIWELLEPCFRGHAGELYRVRLYETPELYGEYPAP
jgi:6-pyruvoyltetrahydropterin/6-carboxytetrahydropterin synthase